MLSTNKVAAAGMASATTAALGSYFGVLGTVGAAAATSVVSAVSSELYQRSLDRTADRLRSRTASTRARVAGEPDRPRRRTRGPALPAMIFGSLLIFALGMAVVSGVEYVRGAPLSGGSGGTTIGDVLHGTLAPTTRDAPVVGDLLGTSRESDTNSTDPEKRQNREQPGLVNGILSGL